MDDTTVPVIDGSTYLLSDRCGDVADGTPHGLFCRDVRHLSQWELLVDGRHLTPVEARVLEYDEALFVLAERTGTVYRDPELSIRRHRRAGGGLRETVTLTNSSDRPRPLTLTVLFDADFADVFDVKGQHTRHRRRPAVLGDGEVTLSYEREGYRRCTVIRAPGARVTARSVELAATVGAQRSLTLTVEVQPVVNDRPVAVKPSRRPDMDQALEDWIASAPRLETDWETLRRVYDRSLLDLAALRFYPDGGSGCSVPAAGMPWYMALFGRDSLLTSYFALPYRPELCRCTLRVLAERQATETDDFRDAEPGKILHELRFGESAVFGERPESPYYGTADATPLFLVVLDEYHRWTGDGALVADLEPAARAALGWLETYADSTGDGYVDYATRNPRTGIENQCWKDSPTSIVHPDDSPAALPRATCELQGYAYDARLRTARLARECWHDAALADRLERDAAALRSRFLRDYWLPETGWFALALDGEGHPVRTLTSNIGHLLWSGIVPDDLAARVAAHLTSDRLFSGWGVRTLATGQAAYNPFGYHVGTVWPHDNAVVAAGLARYGHREAAALVGTAMLEAAPYLGDRLPEALGGQDRGDTFGRPVRYPSAACPQAWASAAPLQFLTTLLDLRPGTDDVSGTLDTVDGPRRLTLVRTPKRRAVT